MDVRGFQHHNSQAELWGDFAAWADGVRTARVEERRQSTTVGEHQKSASRNQNVPLDEEKLLGPVKCLCCLGGNLMGYHKSGALLL